MNMNRGARDTTVKNLRLLAEYVDKHVPEERIKMAVYFVGSGSQSRLSKHFCGTAGCLLGHSTYLFNTGLDKFKDHYNWFDIDAFGLHYFPALYFKASDDFIDVNEFWKRVFHYDLPNNKAWLVNNLLQVANELEEMQA